MKLSETMVCAGIVAGLVFLITGCGGGNSGPGTQTSLNPKLVDLTRITKLGRAFLIYANDWDSDYPEKNWGDTVQPYYGNALYIHSPAVAPPGYGFAFNADLVGQNTSGFQGHIPIVFDSTNLAYSVVASTKSMPNPGRYYGTNMVFYTDGSLYDPVDPKDPKNWPNLALSNVKQQGIGCLIYASDFDDLYPPGQSWMTATANYIKPQALQSPALGAGVYGYALSTGVAGKSSSSLTSPWTTAMTFDSKVMKMNALSNTSTVPVPGRNNGYDAIGFADGHAVLIKK